MKDVVLPSGYTIKVKRLSPLTFLKVLNNENKNYGDMGDLSVSDMMIIMADAIMEVVIDPKIVKKKVDVKSNNCILLEDISPEDITYLMTMVSNDLSVFGKSFRSEE